VLLAVTYLLLATPPVVLAAGQWVLERSWGTYGQGPGQFNGPVDVVVGSNGLVYVSDVGNNRIQVFTDEGIYLFEWGAKGSGGGQFLGPEGIAIDEFDVMYVTDDGNCRVQEFILDGSFLDAWGGDCGTGPGGLQSPRLLAVGQGFAYIIAHSSIEKFSVDGTFVLQFPQTYAYEGVALGQDGSVWATVPDFWLVRQLGTDGSLIQEWSALPPGAKEAHPIDIDLDNAGNVYLANSVWGTIEKFTPGGSHLDTIPADNLPRGIDIVDDRELYVVGLLGNNVYKYKWVAVPVEETTWGGIKAQYREFHPGGAQP
jgi:DNA-binding beta-propeller fold protein YncE